MKTKLSKELVQMYRKMRVNKPFMLVGSDAKCSLDSAKTLLAFREAESDGLVRMRCEPENESYFDAFGKPDPKRGQTQSEANAELEELIDQLGCWWTCSEWFDGHDWQLADSCGMHVGYRDPLDPFENCYVIDEMRAALDALADHRAEQSKEESESHRAACCDIATV